jgi:hypothetical protein
MTPFHRGILCDLLLKRETFSIDGRPYPAKLMKELFDYVLDNNFFEFDGKVYHQVQGTAMGTSMAPPYANVVVGSLLFKLFQKSDVLNFGHVFYICSFIDDIFGIVYGTEDQLRNIRDSIKRQLQINISFEFGASVDFLDCTISIDPTSGVISWKTHQKALNAYLYLPPHSGHPVHQRVSYVFGELIRYARLCKHLSDYLLIAELFYARLSDRGFTTATLRRLFFGVTSNVPVNFNNIKNTPLESAWIKGQSFLDSVSPGGFRRLGFSIPTTNNILTSTSSSSLVHDETPPLKLFLQYNHAKLGAVDHVISSSLSAHADMKIQRVDTTRPSLGKLFIRAASKKEGEP